MKKILAALATVAVSSVALAANPFQLVGLAYNGYLEAQGIPSFSGLCVYNGTAAVSAKELVAAGVEAGYVTAEQAASSSYVSGVKLHLRGICRD
jgi:hypothetical protein